MVLRSALYPLLRMVTIVYGGVYDHGTINDSGRDGSIDT